MDITTFLLSKSFTTAIVNKRAGKEIMLADYSGQLDEDALNSLKESISSSINLDGKIYRLASMTSTEFRYINTMTEGATTVVSMTELDINKTTGEFFTKILIVDQTPVAELKAELEAHIADMTMHITDDERNYWNNKVTAEVEPDGPDYKLNLIK